jgi:hypothetical protein
MFRAPPPSRLLNVTHTQTLMDDVDSHAQRRQLFNVFAAGSA